MEAGDVMFHCLSSPHGSAANESGQIRRILYFHFAAREVVEDSYPQWKYPEPDDARALAASYMELRGDARSPHISAGDESFVFAGDPCTPPYHWRSLIADFDSAKAERLRAVHTPVVTA